MSQPECYGAFASSRTEVYAALDSERDYQDSLVAANHGDPAPRKSIEEFAVYIDDYLRELKTQISRTWGPGAYAQALHTLRKITALGVAAMEVNGAVKRETK